jgi:aminopeptidase YwaD
MFTLRRKFQSLFLAALLVGTALAQQPTSTTASPDRVRQVVEYLSSDALSGRRTGSQGANDAAHYIAGEFNRYGLRPGLQIARPARTRGETQSRYLQPFPYVASVTLGNNNLFYVNPGRADDIAQFRVGEDWMPLGFSSNASIKSTEIVFAGYGISSAELKYDDYAVSKVKDRLAIVFAGTPDGDNPHGQFVTAGQIRFRVAAARAAGAQALLIIANEEKLQDDRLARLSYDNAGEAGIPVLVISRRLAKKLLYLPNPDMTLEQFEKMAADARLIAAKPEPRPTESPDPSVLRRGEFKFSPGLERLPITNLSVTISTNVVRRESPSFNVVGVLPGSDPNLRNEAIVIGAHYDHLGLGGEGSLAAREGQIHHGADDNASGVAGLIELARMLSSQRPKPRRTVVFIAFSGEEEGLIGSNYYVNHPIFPIANTVAMINMDMIGRLKERNLIVGGVGTAQEWRPMIDAANLVPTLIEVGSLKNASSPPAVQAILSSGKPTAASNPKAQFLLTLNEDGFGPSDHSSFYAKQVPVLFFWTGTHEDYHKPSDTAEKINYEGEARIVSLAANIVRDIDRHDKRPTYTLARSESQGRSTGFRVYLGTIPNYADSNDGLKLDGVRDDSPASKAGLKAGDKIVKMAGRDVKNVYDYTYALGEMKAGQEYEVEIVRGNERLTFKITPAGRK